MKLGTTLASVVVLILCLSSCGGNSSPAPTTSGVKPRAFVSNSVLGVLQIIDAKHDGIVSGHQISVGSQPTLMALPPNKQTTLVFDAGSNSVSVVNNSKESQTVSIPLPGSTESMAVAPNNNFAYAAVPSATVLGQQAGVVQVLNLVANTAGATLNIPQAHWIVLNHNGRKMLVFGDNSDNVTIVDTSQIGVGNPYTTVSLDPGRRPVWGVFSDDDSTAYIMDCGSECGGVSAGVTVLNMSNNMVGNTVDVSGATKGLLDSGNLYVAGSASGGGTLQVVKVSSMTASAPVTISGGYHYLMALASNNKLIIGARNCVTNGCLSVFDTGTSSVFVDAPAGDVTGMQPIVNRNVAYVIEGGELRVIDTTTGRFSTDIFIDIVGQAFDVKEVD